MDHRRKPGLSHERVSLILPAVLLALLMLLAASVFAPVFPAMLWGALLAVISSHPYERLVSHLHGRRWVADIVFGFLMLMVLVLPAVFFAWEAVLLLPKLSALPAMLHNQPLPELPQWIVGLPGVGVWLDAHWSSADAALRGAMPVMSSHLEQILGWFIAQIGTFGGFVAEFMLGAVLALFILHNRFAVRAFLDRLFLKIGGELTRQLMIQAFEVTRGSFAGLFAASMVQTILTIIAVLVTGLPGVVIFAGLTFLMAIVQVGPIVTLLLAGGMLVAEGSYMAAALMVLWFVAVIMPVDNLIRPWFSSREAGVPAILSFLGSMGGLLHWGLIGIFMGPVLTTALYQLLIAWMNMRDEV